MSLNNDLVLFSTTWDIDQIITQGSTTVADSVGSGAYKKYVLANHNLGYPPVTDMLVLPASNQWLQSGATYNLISYWHYVDNFNLYLAVFNGDATTVSFNSQIKYFIWSDTVVY